MPDSDSPAAAAAAHDIHAYLAQHERKELLRFLTCGSVDDGKSTLIGRLLFDSKMVYEDQLAAVKADSIKHGTVRDADFDPALLTDGLRAEREQGITIDVAYRYFSTTKRKFIIADTPGHEQYTRNMATGASNCDLAIILIDARHGVLEQTRRHSFIASLLGIRHVVVAINKMDLADWSESRYEEIRDQYLDFSAKLDLPDIEFIPMSALKGDNVVNPSDAMPWYTGGTLMHLLENVPIASDRNLIDMRFPVQFVLRPDLNFRGFAGTLAGGTLRPGDAVTALPSRQQSTIKQIIRPSAFATKEQGDEADGYKTLDVAYPPMAVTVTLEDEIDLSRGDMLVHSGNVPTVGRRFDAMIVWMSDEPMRPHHPYLVKHTSHTVPGAISEVRYRIDVNTFHRHDTEGAGLKLNEIGRCGIELAQPIAFDPYKKNRQTGGFILVDRMSNNTVAAGMILDRQPSTPRKDSTRGEASPHSSRITPEQRHKRLAQRPATIWITGLTGSGKTTLAYALEQRLFELGHLANVLDGRNARLGLSTDLDFSPEDRTENLRRAAHVARLFNETGLISICAFLSPNEGDRRTARDVIGDERMLEVYLSAPPEVAEQRREHPRRETDAVFFDESNPYQPPQQPELTLPTHELEVDACLDRLLDLLRERGVLQ